MKGKLREGGRPAGGGVAARRAVMRWAWRLFRREWRQQALVLALLTVAVASAIGFASASYNTTGVSENSVFGDANHLYIVEAPDASTLAAAAAAAEERFGAIEVIGRWTVPIPGSVDSIELRAQDPAGALSGPMLALMEGHYPKGPGEVALTDGVANALELTIGETFDLAGDDRRVAGVVENPSDLNSEFALVAPSETGAATSLTMLVGGTGAFEEVAELRDFGAEHLPNAEITSRSGNENVAATAAAAVLATAAQALLLVSLVAAAGFIAVAQRRLRQLGMLGAVGATKRHLRLVVIGNGVVIGSIAAVAGAVLGLAGWIAVAPWIEGSVGYRIDPFNVPWWLIGGAMVLALVAGVGAAWWPARMVARIPITRALSGRPASMRPAHHSALLAALLIALGVGALIAADRSSVPLVLAGTLLTGVGILLASPLAVHAMGRLARSLPVAPRLALRDLSRHRTRSAFALAAIGFTLAMPVASVVTARAEEQATGLGNVSERQLLVWTRDPSQPEGVSPMFTEDPSDAGFSPFLPRLTDADLTEMEAQVEEISRTLDGSTVVALELATDPALEDTPDGRLAATVAMRTEIGFLDIAPVFVATPRLLEIYGLDLQAIDPVAEIITVPPSDRLPEQTRAELQGDELWFGNVSGEGGGLTPEPISAVQSLTSGYTSIPGSFIAPDALRARNWESVPVGWLIETAAPITTKQLNAARSIAADAGLLIESRREEHDASALHWQATLIGMLVALGVLAMTVGLIRNEGARDLRTLTATGATTGIRRTLTATTAAGLALCGALLGTAGAYLALGASYARELGVLTPVPIAHLATIVIGVPLAAALAGWLLAGREPQSIGRPVFE